MPEINNILDRYFEHNTVKIIASYYYANHKITKEDCDIKTENRHTINSIIKSSNVMCRKYKLALTKKIILMCEDMNFHMSEEYHTIYDQNLDTTYFSLMENKHEYCDAYSYIYSQAEANMIRESYSKAKVIKNSLVYSMTLFWCKKCPDIEK
jgi:hypothetical protein